MQKNEFLVYSAVNVYFGLLGYLVLGAPIAPVTVYADIILCDYARIVSILKN
jgi:hypothetical protein